MFVYPIMNALSEGETNPKHLPKERHLEHAYPALVGWLVGLGFF